MKARINKYFIKLTRKPEEDIINGLVVELSEPQDEYSLPIMKTNINKGQKKYQYPQNMKGKVLSARVELSTVDRSYVNSI